MINEVWIWLARQARKDRANMNEMNFERYFNAEWMISASAG